MGVQIDTQRWLLSGCDRTGAAGQPARHASADPVGGRSDVVGERQRSSGFLRRRPWAISRAARLSSRTISCP